MGPEPYLDVMDAHPDYNVIVGGRSYDPSPYVAYAYRAFGTGQTSLHGLSKEQLGGILHMGKIMECGGQCATPKSPGARATVYRDGRFDVVPLDPNSRCIPRSVAAHTLYEKSRPDLLYGPGGILDLTTSTYEQLVDQRSVRCWGSVFRSSAASGVPYTVKLEGARVRGYRSISMGAFRDPALTGQLEDLFKRIRAYVAYQHKEWNDQWWELDLHKFGAWHEDSPGEVFVVCEAHAQSQELATSLVNTARVACIHGPYHGQKATSGNFAFGIGGLMEAEVGACPEFCIYHIMELATGQEGAHERDNLENLDISGKQAKGIFTYTTSMFGKDGGAITPAASSVSAPTDVSSKTPFAAAQGLKAEEFVFPPKIATLGDITPTLRSKNSGPYEITFDILFPSPAVYSMVQKSGVLTSESVAQLYDLDPSQVIYCGFFEQAWAFKATIPRMRKGVYATSGSFGEEDVHGSQLYLPLTNLRLPQDLICELQAIKSPSEGQGS
jgi:hypothetical protein